MAIKPLALYVGAAVATAAVLAGVNYGRWSKWQPPVAPSGPVEVKVVPPPQPAKQPEQAAEQPAKQPEQAPKQKPEQAEQVAPKQVEKQPSQPAQQQSAQKAEQQPAQQQPAQKAEQQAAQQQPAAQQPVEPQKQAAVEPQQQPTAEPQKQAAVEPLVPPVPAEESLSFDIVRVEPDGSTVVAGRSHPGADVVLKLDGQVIGGTKASARGEWVIVPDQPIAKGDHQLTLEATDSDGKIAVSQQAVIIKVPESGEEKPLIVLAEPQKPSQVLQTPETTGKTVVAEKQPAQPAQQQPAQQQPVQSAEQQPAEQQTAQKAEQQPVQKAEQQPAEQQPAQKAEQQPAEQQPAQQAEQQPAQKAEQQPAQPAQQPSSEQTAEQTAAAKVAQEAAAKAAEQAAKATQEAVAKAAEEAATKAAQEAAAKATQEAAAKAAEEAAAKAAQEAAAKATQEAAAKAAEEAAAKAAQEAAAKATQEAAAKAAEEAAAKATQEAAAKAAEEAAAKAAQEAAARQAAARQAAEAVARKALGLGSVDYDDKGNMMFAGRAVAGSTVRLYVDNGFLGDATADGNGNWTYSGQEQIADGDHRLRVDSLGNDGQVMARVEVPFTRAGQQEIAALQKSRQVEQQAPAKTPTSETTAPTMSGEKAAEAETPAATEGPAKADKTEAPAQQQAAVEQKTAPPAEEMAQPPAPKVGRVVIQPGNNLWRIARIIYGRGIQYTTIYKANKSDIRNPDLIYPGQIFTTPGVMPPKYIDPRRRRPLTPEERAAAEAATAAGE